MFKEKFFLPAALLAHMEQRGQMAAAKLTSTKGCDVFTGVKLPITADRWQYDLPKSSLSQGSWGH